MKASCSSLPPRIFHLPPSGFKKIKGRSRMSSRSKSTDHGDAYGDGAAAAAAAAAGAAPTESESWEEFRHPQFRRGRRDLLVGIKRQKDSGRLKRKRGERTHGEKQAPLGDW